MAKRKRKMKPTHIKAKREKEVRSIYKQIRVIRTEQRALGYYKLEKPIRHGWYKELIITQNVDRYKNEKVILEVYQKIEKRFWGRTKDKASENWQKQVSNYYIYKGLPTLSHKSFNKLSDKAKKICVVYQYRNHNKKLRTRFYIKFPKGAYRIRFKRAFVTDRERIDPKLEQTLDLLEQRLEKNGYYEEHQKIYNCKWHTKPLESRKKVKQKLKQIIESYDDFESSYDY